MQQREIKFRAWDRKDLKMYHFNGLWYDAEYQSLAFRVKSEEVKGYDYTLPFDEEDMSEVMQYTGLKDKKGTEIYEGDILICKHSYREPELCEVGFEDGRFGLVDGDGVPFCGFWMYVGDGTDSRYDTERHDRYEVVGNIYEDAKLLNEE